MDLAEILHKGGGLSSGHCISHFDGSRPRGPASGADHPRGMARGGGCPRVG